MGLFPISHGFSYIFLVVDYVSRWLKLRSLKLIILNLLSIL